MRAFLLVALLAGCARPDPLECTATVNDTVSTVIGVEWSAEEGSTSTVEFGESKSYGMTTPATSAADVHLDLLGMPVDTDVFWHGVSTAADGTTSECSGKTHTGTAPSDFPLAETVTDDDGQWDGQFVIGAFFTGAGGSGGRAQLAAFRRDGALVWYWQDAEGTTGMDLHFAQDGSGILFNEYTGAMGGDEVTINRMSMTGEILATAYAPKAHHMFCELPDGTLAYDAVDSRSYTDPDSGDTDDWVGDAIVEIAADGTTETVFSVWDVLTPRENDRMDGGSIYPGVDWTHGNMLGFYPDSGAEGTYLLSLGHADDILLVDRATREVTTMYGVDGATVTPQFDYQHGVNQLPNGDFLMFMTTLDGAGAIEYAPVDGGLEEVWRSNFGRKPFALGQAQRLPNGNTFINGGAGGNLTEVTPDGTVVWELDAETPFIFGQFQLVSSLYPTEQ